MSEINQDRELRLRRRIDQLLDEIEKRDTIIAKLRKRLHARSSKIVDLVRSRDLWRHRALRR
jgi:hypothetical protein